MAGKGHELPFHVNFRTSDFDQRPHGRPASIPRRIRESSELRADFDPAYPPSPRLGLEFPHEKPRREAF